MTLINLTLTETAKAVSAGVEWQTLDRVDGDDQTRLHSAIYHLIPNETEEVFCARQKS